MAINKKLIHFNTFEKFNSMKLSANKDDNAYTVGIHSETTDGSPDIKYTSICWIKDSKQMWTHGTLYDCSDFIPEGSLGQVYYKEYTENN